MSTKLSKIKTRAHIPKPPYKNQHIRQNNNKHYGKSRQKELTDRGCTGSGQTLQALRGTLHSTDQKYLTQLRVTRLRGTLKRQLCRTLRYLGELYRQIKFYQATGTDTTRAYKCDTRYFRKNLVVSSPCAAKVNGYEFGQNIS